MVKPNFFNNNNNNNDKKFSTIPFDSSINLIRKQYNNPNTKAIKGENWIIIITTIVISNNCNNSNSAYYAGSSFHSSLMLLIYLNLHLN